MKRMYLAALAGALAISTMAVAIDEASAAYRGGAYRGGFYRGGVGVGRVGIGYGRYGYRGGYYRRGLGVAAGVAVGAAAAGAYYGGSGYYGSGSGYDSYASGYNGASGYNAYASADVDPDNAYILNGTYISETDAVAYCAQRFRSYDIGSRTFLAYGGERVSCPQ